MDARGVDEAIGVMLEVLDSTRWRGLEHTSRSARLDLLEHGRARRPRPATPWHTPRKSKPARSAATCRWTSRSDTKQP